MFDDSARGALSGQGQRLRLLLGVVVLVGGGCSAFRAQVGYGLGVGAEVQLSGVLHTGLMAGSFDEFGPHYGYAPEMNYGAYLDLVFFHIYDTTRRSGIAGFEGGTSGSSHMCFGVLPRLTGWNQGPYDSKDDDWATEVGLALLFVDLRLGFNPTRLRVPPAGAR